MAGNGNAGTPKKIYEKKWIERSAGSELAQSRKSPGGHAPYARDGAGIKEQVVIHDKKPKMPKTPGGSGAVADFLTDIAIAATVFGVQTFIDKGIPAIKKNLAEKRAAKTAEVSATDVATVEQNVELPVGEEVAELGNEVDTQQWYRLFFDAVAHGAAGRAHQAISAEAWQALASARVTDDPGTQALASAMRELTPEQVDERVSRVLAQHPELLEGDPETVLRKLFDEGDDALEPLLLERDDVAPETPRYLAAEEPEQPADDDETPQP